MKSLIESGIRRLMLALGFDIVPRNQPDFDTEDRAVMRRVAPFTMTSTERLYALRQAVKYVVAHRIPGALVECGVWKGGSMMLAAMTLLEAKAADRRLYLYDTFEGMSAPTEFDHDYAGHSAEQLLAAADRSHSLVWAASPLVAVQTALRGTGYDEHLIQYIQGKVEDTIPATLPDVIAILRLDTDWYESTYHELTHLYPRLAPGGVLIIDDYGHWQGARRAVDQYLHEHRLPLLLHRIDYTGRIAVKPSLS